MSNPLKALSRNLKVGDIFTANFCRSRYFVLAVSIDHANDVMLLWADGVYSKRYNGSHIYGSDELIQTLADICDDKE